MLSFLSIKDGVYAAIILALLAAFGAYTLHERRLGEQKIETADAKVAAAAEKQTQTAQTAAQTTETQSAQVYKQAVAIPALGDIGVVCRKTGSGQVPPPDSVATTGSREQPAVGGDGPAFDPSGPLLTRAREADAQIDYLQRRVHELEAEMEASP
jgi:hypothetical protein